MKTTCVIIWLLIVSLLLFPLSALCANAVPQTVLAARDGLVRVCCEKHDGSVISGTGFVIGEGQPVKYIVTSRHVTEDAAAVYVLCAGTLKVGASVYLEDENADLCVLKAAAPLYGLDPLVIDNTGEAKAGDAIYALGFPSASDTISVNLDAAAEDVNVTDGIISAVKTGMLLEDGAAVTLLHMDAALSKGNSGGPLLNENGQVVGVSTFAVTDAQNINAAVSAAALVNLLDTIGIGYKSVTEEKAFNLSVIIIIISGLLIIATGFIVLKRRGKRVIRQSVNDIVQSPMWQIEHELQAILPVVEQVRRLHKKGSCGFDICPENIVISRKGAALRVKSIKPRADGAIIPCPGFWAPERYTNGGVGPWTDVYAVCALVYSAITGRTLPPSYDRIDDTPLFDGLMKKYQALGDAITQGLALEMLRRPSSLDALAVQIQACLIGFNPYGLSDTAESNSKGTSRPPVARQDVKKTGNMSGKMKIAMCGIVVGVILLGGTWLVNEVNYSQAAAYIESGAYSKAQRSLKGVFSFYGDAAIMSRYTDAGVRLDSGEYEAAARLFSALGQYRDASQMVSEATYCHAQYLMQNGRYTEAEALLNALGDYKDTAQMRTEVAYQSACAYLDAGLCLSALEVFQTIEGYRDTALRAEEAKRMIYNAALSALNAGDADTALSSFAAISGFELSNDYLRLCNLLICAKSGSPFTQDDYAAFLSLTEIMDITPYLTSDALITHYLCGKWQDDEGNLFVMGPDGAIQYNLPGMDSDSYVFKDGVLYMTQSDGTEEPMFEFSCVDFNTVSLYCFTDSVTYTMTRRE